MIEKYNSITESSVLKNTNKYYLIHVDERNGEREYTEKIVRMIPANENALQWADKNIAATWLGDDGEAEGDGYYFDGGQYCVSIGLVKEITLQEFETLLEFL